MQEFPEPCVGALILNPQGKLLLLKSHKWSNMYVIPGGHIEVGEKAREALKREIKEETNLDIHDIAFLQFQDFIFDKVYIKERHLILLNFVCKAKDQTVKLNDEAQEFVWIDPKEALEKLPVEPYTKRALETYLKGA